MDQNREARVDPWPSAELFDRDGKGDERGGRQQPYLERSAAAGRLEIAAFQDERKAGCI